MWCTVQIKWPAIFPYTVCDYRYLCCLQIEEKTKTSGKVQQLFEILFDPGNEKDKRETCANNLVALAKERAGM